MDRDIYGEDHDLFHASVRAFVETALMPRHQEMLTSRSVLRDSWKQASAAGLLGLCIPEQYGGAGADDFRFNAIVAEEVSAFSVGVAACLSIHSDGCPPCLVEIGTEEQKKRWLPAKKCAVSR